MTQTSRPTANDYSSGHSWYYLLGGAVLSPKQIREETRQSRYRGYAKDDIFAADNKPEPQRSAALRQLRATFEVKLKEDMAIYRNRVLAMHRHRKDHGAPQNPSCSEDVHMAVMLKHNHLVNGFAHLVLIEGLLNKQGDLFGI